MILVRRTAALLLLTCATPAHAGLITGHAAGQLVSRSGPADPSPFPRFVLGDQVEVSFTYDSDTAVAVGNAFVLPGATYKLAAFQTPFRSGFSSNGGDLIATNGPPDTVEIGIGGERGRITLEFSDPSGAAIPGSGLPTLAQLRAFPLLTLTYGSAIAFGGQGFVAEMTMMGGPSAVPEPSGLAQSILAILGTGLAGWLGRRNRTA